MNNEQNPGLIYPELSSVDQPQINPYQTSNTQQNYTNPQPNYEQNTPYHPFINQSVIKCHNIRNHKTWHDLIEETSVWVNSKLHVLRVINISVVYCHTTGSGQCSVFYNDSQEPKFKELILNNLNRTLGVALIQTTKSWQKHHDKLLEALPKLATTGGIIGVSQLQVDHSHNRSLSIIWYRK